MASKPEERLALHIWEAVREHLPSGKREECAEGILRALEEYGMDGADLAGLRDEDEDIAEAYEAIFGSDEDEDEEPFEEDADYDEED
jgi:hypothetical protein